MWGRGIASASHRTVPAWEGGVYCAAEIASRGVPWVKLPDAQRGCRHLVGFRGQLG